MTRQWHTQMTIWCGAVMLFGLVMTGGAFYATSAGVYALFGVLAGPGPTAYDPALRFSLALIGAVTLGWGATLLAVVRGTADMSASQTAPLWRMITIAVLMWFVIDSGLSIATGFWRNAVSNSVLPGWYLLLMARYRADAANRVATA